MLWHPHVLGAMTQFSARVCFREMSVVLQMWGLGLIPTQITKAGRLGTDFNLSFWNSSCKKQPQIGKAQLKYIFLILPSKSYPNEIYQWKAKLAVTSDGKVKDICISIKNLKEVISWSKDTNSNSNAEIDFSSLSLWHRQHWKREKMLKEWAAQTTQKEKKKL